MISKLLNTPFLFFLLWTVLVQSAASQDLVFKKDIKLKSGLRDQREVLPIVKDDNSLSLILVDNRTFSVIELDPSFQETNSYEVPGEEVLSNFLMGYSLVDGKYHLYFANKNQSQFLIKTIDPATKRSTLNAGNVRLKKEKFIESVSYQNKFYILAVQKFSSILLLYEFNGAEMTLRKEFDLSNQMVSQDLHTKLNEGTNRSAGGLWSNQLPVAKIESNNPVALELSSYTSKVFYYDNQLFLTLDGDINFTEVITINLDTYESTFERFTKSWLEDPRGIYLASNSFLLYGTLYQVKASKSALKMQVKTLKSDESLVEYGVTEDQEISFKNGPVWQEGGTSIYTIGTDKALDKTKKALRRIANGNVGISAFEQNGKTTLTIGSYKEVTQSGGGMSFGTTGPMAISTPEGVVTVPGSFSYNPTMNSYESYTMTRSVHFKTLLDSEEHTHIQGPVLSNAFDKIRDFEKPQDLARTIFKMDDFYFYGCYTKQEQSYSLHRFFSNIIE